MFEWVPMTHISLVDISAGICDALQALVDDGHHMLLCVGEQAVALAQLAAPPLVQILQFLKASRTHTAFFFFTANNSER